MAEAGRFLKGAIAIGLSFVTAPIPGVGAYISAALFSYGVSQIVQGIQRSFTSERQAGIKANVTGTQASIPLVYGQVRVGMRIVDTRVVNSTDPLTPLADPTTIFAGADNDDVLVRVGALALGGEGGHGINKVLNIRFNSLEEDAIVNGATGLDSTTDLATTGVANTTGGQDWDEHLKYTLRLGADGQTAPTSLVNNLGWTTSYKGVGVAYIALYMKYDTDKWRGGIPSITAEIQGVLVYDPRNPTGGPGLDGYIYSDNPALCILDYLTSKRYGAGYFYPERDGGDTTFSEIDEQSFIDAANYCDDLVTYDGTANTQKRFTLNGVVDTAADAASNLEEMKATCRGQLVWQGGKQRLVIRQPKSPVAFELTEDNIIGQLRYRRRGSDVPNLIETTYVEPGNGVYVAASASWPLTGTTTYLDADNGVENRMEIDLNYVTNYYRALQISMVLLRELREDMMVVCTATEDALDLQVGDVVRLTHSSPDWTQKEFWVENMALNPDGTILVAMQEYDANAYSLDAGDAQSTLPGTNLPNPYYIAAPTNLQLVADATTAIATQDGQKIPRILVTWDPVVNPFLVGYEVTYRLSTETDQERVSVPPPNIVAERAYITPVTNKLTYNVEVKAVNYLGIRSVAVSGNILVDTDEAAARGFPLFDVDADEVYLFPHFITGQSVRYYISDTPGVSLATIESLGTLSTLDSILVHTFTTPGEKKYGACAIYTDLAGTENVSEVFEQVVEYIINSSVTPELFYRKAIPTGPDPANSEAVEFVARDQDGNNVAIYYRTYNEGDIPPVYTRNPGAGYVADPHYVKVEVTKPSEGGTRKVIEAYAEDSDGNVSSPPIIVFVDGDKIPSGSLVAVLSDSGAVPRIIPNTIDSDTGSWRFKVFKTTEGDDTFPSLVAGGPFSDISTDEFSGATFGVPVDLDVTHKLDEGEILNVTGLFFATTSATAANQQTSLTSVPVKIQIKPSGAVNANAIDVLAAQWRLLGSPIPGFGFEFYAYQLNLAPGALVQSMHIRYYPWDNPLLDKNYDFDLSGPTLHALRNETTPTNIQFFIAASDLIVEITPYDAVGGAGGAGDSGPQVTLRTGVASENTGFNTEDTEGTDRGTDKAIISKTIGIKDDPTSGRTKLGAFFAVDTFGADITGVTDSTTEVQAAIDKAEALGGGWVSATGVVLVSQLNLKKGVELVGDGWLSTIKQAPNSHTVDVSGTTSAGSTANTLNDSSKTWTVNEHRFKTVYLPVSGQRRMIISNTATQLTIGMESGVGSENWSSTPGTGVSYQILSPKPLITNTDLTDGQWAVRNIRLDGNKANQLAFNSGIYPQANPASVEFSDSMNMIENVLIKDMSGTGLLKGPGCRELSVRRLRVENCDRHGIFTEPEGGTDNVHEEIIAAHNGLSGIVVNGSNDRYVNAKSFGNGAKGITNQMHGWLVTVVDGATIIAADAQENPEHGFSFVSSKNVRLVGRAMSNNLFGVNLFDCQFLQIDIEAVGNEGLLYVQDWAVGDSSNGASPSTNCYINVVADGTHSSGRVQTFLQDNDNYILVNNRNKGKIWSTWGTLGTQHEHLLFGKDSAPLANEPQYAFKTESNTPSDALFESYDLTNVRTFLRFQHTAQKLVLGYFDRVPEVVVDGRLVIGTPNSGSPSSKGLVNGEIALEQSKWIKWERTADDTLRQMIMFNGSQLSLSPDGFDVITGGGLNPGDVVSVFKNTGEAFRFGKAGAPGSGNPYYVLKHNGGTPPLGVLSGYDGTTSKDFLTFDFGNGKLILGNATNVFVHQIREKLMVGNPNSGSPPTFNTGDIVLPQSSTIRFERTTDNTSRGMVTFNGSALTLSPEGFTVKTGGGFEGGNVISVFRDTGEAFRYGKVGAPGSGNPYYVWKHDAGSPPLGRMESWDGTTSRVYMSFDHANNAMGFFGATGTAKPTVSGSKGGNAALSSLMTALSGLGLVTDSTT